MSTRSTTYYYPNCETTYNADGIMRQRFTNGAEIEACTHGGGMRLTHQGKLVDFRAGDVSLEQLTEFQKRAEAMGNN